MKPSHAVTSHYQPLHLGVFTEYSPPPLRGPFTPAVAGGGIEEARYTPLQAVAGGGIEEARYKPLQAAGRGGIEEARYMPLQAVTSRGGGLHRGGASAQPAV